MNTKAKPIRVGSATPWGPAQTAEDLGQGVILVETAGHGGIYVPPELMHWIPEDEQEYAAKWSGSRQWYEEDCAIAIPLYRLGIVPEWLTKEQVLAHYESVKGYWQSAA